ncbi:MAG: hypothetical protein HHJ09_00565 [Glaciimonas sp.]|nr:hypothetical protein [Glaciimonas sp.]
MLNAILFGKKRGSGFAGIDLREEFEGAEDILTASVFERLFYLDDQLAMDILLSKQIWTASIPDKPKPLVIRDILFWDRLSLDGGQIEPDCMVIFDDLILVIEAKRWDYRGQQLASQLADEYRAAIHKYPDKKIALLAVGGMIDDRSTTRETLEMTVRANIKKSTSDDKLVFSSTSWANLFAVATTYIPDTPAGKRLLKDIGLSFNLHGIRTDTPTWLIELTDEKWQSIRDIRATIPECLKPINLLVDITKAEDFSLFSSPICTTPDFFWRLQQ